MIFTINNKELLSVMTHLDRVSPNKNYSLPIIKCVLFNVANNKATLTATDLEFELTTEVECSGNDSCSIAIPSKKLLGISKLLPTDCDIVFAIKDDGDVETKRVSITAGSSQFNVQCLSGKDFPSIDFKGGRVSFDIDAGKLQYMINTTAFSMAVTDARYYLNGMLWDISSHSFQCVATDGHRLAAYKSDIGYDANAGDHVSVIMPNPAITKLASLLKSGVVKIDIGLNVVRIQGEKFSLITKLIDGKFPEWERVIPKNLDKKAIINKADFSSALMKAAILSTEKYKGCRLTFSDGSLEIETEGDNNYNESLAVAYSGPETSIGFNIGYLTDVLKAIDSVEVIFAFTDHLSSGSITFEGNDCRNYIAMPMRI